ncbi:MAG: hypothetical protein AAGE94_02960 [Acidobacteriota bacterium]
MTHTRHITRSLCTFTLAFALLASAASAATLDVCASGCTYSTVAGAVAAASSGDTVELANETFNEGGLTISADITVRSASGMATIDGGSHGWVFKIAAGSIVDLESLQLLGGTYARLDNRGMVDLSTVFIFGSGPSVPSTFGGIANFGSMTIGDASAVSGNASVSSGGGINNFGDLVVIGSTVMSNFGGDGGGLLNHSGNTSVIASSFSANNASKRGGAWANIALGGTVAFHGSSSTSTNTANVACDTSWDAPTSTCVN